MEHPSIILWSGLPNRHHLIQRYMGPYQLGHWLESHGYPYQVIDFVWRSRTEYIPAERLVAITKPYIGKRTRAIGFSSTFFGATHGNAIPSNVSEAIGLLRQQHPGLKFILGGNNAENISPDVTKLFDAVVIGLAEDIMLELMRWYDGAGPEPRYRRPIQHKTRFYYADDAEPVFDIRDSKHQWQDKDHIMPGEVLPLEISRGCIFHCRFCQYPLLGRSKYDYTRNMEHIRQELIYNHQNWKTDSYFLLDDTFNDTPIKVRAFHDMVKSLPFRIQWTSYIRADLLHRFPETIPLIRDAGCRGAFFGIESFGKQAALHVGKGWSASHAQEFLPHLIHDLWQDQVSTHISLIAGLPGDTPESLHATVDWLHANDLHGWNFHPLWVMKHSETKTFSSTFAKEAESHGYEFPNPDLPFQWVNQASGWTRESAWKMAEELNARKDPEKHTLDIWNEISLGTLGYDPAQTLHMPVSRIPELELWMRSNLWLHNYMRSLESGDNDHSPNQEFFERLRNMDGTKHMSYLR